MDKKVAILFPNGNTARHLGIRLIETQHTVVVHCGREEGWKVADNMIEEMKIAARDLHHKLGLGSISLGNDQSRFKLSTGVDFTDCDILVLPSLDVVRSRPYNEYIAMVTSHFRELKDRGLKIAGTAKIVFGSNKGGLAAAAMWAKVFPDHKMQLIVVSSLYEASKKMFGESSPSRALPMKRIGGVAFTMEGDTEVHTMLKIMGEATKNDDYSTEEAKLLHRAVTLLLEEDIEELEIVGRFPNPADIESFKLKNRRISWIPTKQLSWWEEFQSKCQSS